MQWVKGTELNDDARREALARFCHRYTGDHKPNWVTWEPLHFASDASWLENTKFAVTKSGRLSRAHSYCQSSPTWPEGK